MAKRSASHTEAAPAPKRQCSPKDWAQEAQSTLRAGALCFRRVPGDAAEKALQVLLVTRQKKQGMGDETWTIPAGKVEGARDANFGAAALRELREEAGVVCEFFADLGWHASKNKHGGPISTRFFLTRCTEELPTWLEDDTRVRAWFSLEEALQKCRYRDHLFEVVRQAGEVLQREQEPRTRQGSGGSVESMERASSHGALPGATTTNLNRATLKETFDFLRHQVGGHTPILKPTTGATFEVEPLPSNGNGQASTESFVMLGDTLILKPLDRFELDAYVLLQRRQHHALKPFLVPVQGTKKMSMEDAAYLSHMHYEHQLGAQQAGSISRKSADDFRRFLVMTDLGYQMRSPAVLDVKMGCFQRSVRSWADPAKRAKRIAKSLGTTTSTLGFRLCGMGNFSDECAQKVDKYEGRQVSAHGMLKALASFFRYDTELMRDVLGALVEKLAAMSGAIENAAGCRFWSSSLLIGFDSACIEEPQAMVASLDARIIDLAHFVDVQGPLPDTEFLVGLRNLQAHLVVLRDHLGGDLDEAARLLEEHLEKPPPPELHEEEEARMAEQHGFNIDAVPRCRSGLGRSGVAVASGQKPT